MSTARLREALELVLLFHSSGPWNVERFKRWREIAGSNEATTKRMCDHIRKVLAEPDLSAEVEARMRATDERCDRAQAATALITQALDARDRGDVEAARTCLRQATALFRGMVKP